MADEQFKSGDVVQLMSGGPQMTYVGPSVKQADGTHANCFWFSGEELKTASVPVQALTRIAVGEAHSPGSGPAPAAGTPPP
jgi:uncharacterized protein YodC (DUF2158 family)